MANIPRVLSIAGSDSGGGAGIQADLKTFVANGVYGMTAICALTAQNTQGVHGIEAVPPAFISAQIDACIGDIGVNAVKTGMLATSEVICTVVDALDRHSVQNIVADPVMVAANGDKLLHPGAIDTLKTRLIPIATIVTPNILEAKALTDIQINTLDDAEAAAKSIHSLGAKAVLVKGGSKFNTISDGSTDNYSIDVFFDGTSMQRLSAPLVATSNTHGTGCTLSSAIAAHLAQGKSLLESVRAAKKYITEALQKSVSLSIGKGLHGPLNHGYMIAGANWSVVGAAPVEASSQPYRVPSFAQGCKSAAAGAFNASFSHPFVIALRDGTLDPEKFKFYQMQDARYLEALADVASMISTRCIEPESKAWWIDAAKLALVVETSLHAGYGQKLDYTADDIRNVQLTPNNAAYQNHMVNCAQRGTLVEAIAAFCPCPWLYADLGKHLLKQLGGIPDDHPYADWLRTYSGDSFDAYLDTLLAQLQNCADAVDDCTRQRATEAFCMSCRYEWMFWQQAWELQAWPV